MKKRIISTMLALTVVASMSIPTFAANTDPNLIVVDNTQYSTEITGGGTAVLKLAPANASYSLTGFDSLEAAESGLNFSYNVGGDKVASVTKGGTTFVQDGTTYYAGTLTVKGKSAADYGPASIHVTNEYNPSAYIDMTVYVEADEAQPEVGNISVEVVDVRDSDNPQFSGLYNYTEGLTVEPAVDTPNSAFYQKRACAQTYATVADALNMVASDIVVGDGYITEFTSYDMISDTNVTLGLYSDENDYYNWQYCVVRDGEKLDDSKWLGAGVMPLEAGDVVYWAFGTEQQANEYFDALAQ